MTQTGQSPRSRTHVEQAAVMLFVGAALAMSIVCGAVIVSGWFAGVIEDRFERVFWAGALLAGIMVAVFAAAAFPGGRDDARVIRRVTLLTRIGLVMFVIAPALCIGALVADFYL
jgi:MFS family permease